MKQDNQRHVFHALVNILAFPGLGSWRAGHRLAGAGQIFLALAGSGLVLLWLYKILSQYYGLIFGDEKPESVGWIGIAGGVLFALSWLWAVVTSILMFRAASQREAIPPVLPPGLPPTQADAGIRQALAGLPDWQRDGQSIRRTYEFADFAAAMKFVNAVAGLAERVQHHPDIDLRWNRVTLVLATHEAGGLTAKDFAVARECDGLLLR